LPFSGTGSGGNLWVNSQGFIPLDELAVDYAARIEWLPQKAPFNPLMFAKSKTSVYIFSPHCNQQILPYGQGKIQWQQGWHQEKTGQERSCIELSWIQEEESIVFNAMVTIIFGDLCTALRKCCYLLLDVAVGDQQATQIMANRREEILVL
jgi:hypothetical protein